MDRWRRLVSTIGGRRVIVGIGALYVSFAVGRGLLQIAGGTRVESVAILSLLIGGPGAVVLYGGYRLPRTAIHADFYPDVVDWCLAGIGLMLAFLTLYHLQPGDGLSNPVQSVLILTALSSLAGFGVGVQNAQSKTRAREVTRRNRELQQMKTQLEESNERLEQFAYAASHDLQEPLRMITSYLQLVESRYGDELDADGEEFIEYAVDGADRMQEMIDGLLEYSRVETRGDPFEPVDLDEVIADVRKDLEVSLAESDAEVNVESLPRVTGDYGQLRQVFQNLLQNAVAYSGEEPPTVRVSAERNGTEWTISVADEGIGMDPEDTDRIFEVFHRLHSHEDHDGSGLGLALCERIVERHGGEIWVDSEPDEGATFSFTLPTAESGPEPSVSSDRHAT